MGKRFSTSSVKASLRSSMVLTLSVEKSLAQESQISRLRHHVSVLSRRLHETIVELKKQREIKPAFCVLCGGNHNYHDCEPWGEGGTPPISTTDFGGVVDVAPVELEMEAEEGAVAVVRLPGVAPSEASDVVAEGVADVMDEAESEVAVEVVEEAEEMVAVEESEAEEEEVAEVPMGDGVEVVAGEGLVEVEDLTEGKELVVRKDGWHEQRKRVWDEIAVRKRRERKQAERDVVRRGCNGGSL